MSAYSRHYIQDSADRFNSICFSYTTKSSLLEKEWKQNGRRLTVEENRWLKKLYKFADEYRKMRDSCLSILEDLNQKDFEIEKRKQAL